MDAIVELFSSICGQGRAFSVEGMALPVCERCLGLYVGAVAAGVLLLASRNERRARLGSAALYLQLAVLLLAMAAGLHLVDVGPRWRFACGLWTGYVVVTWMWRARAEWSPDVGRQHAGHSDETFAVVAIASLALLAWAWPLVSTLGWWFWTTLALAGASIVLVSIGFTVSGVLARVVEGLSGLSRARATAGHRPQ